MLQKLRSNIQRQSPALGVAALALFVALGGGSYAALSSDNGGGDKTAKVAEKGKRGPRGPAGPAGAAGAPGPQGSPGAAGSNASFPSTLPSGHTLVGTYAARGTSNGNLTAPTGQTAVAAISFSIPLASPPQVGMLRQAGMGEPGDPSATRCPGSAAAPSAAPGELCIYETSRIINGSPPTPDICQAGGLVCSNTGAGVSSTEGVVLQFHPSLVNQNYGSYGTWAVTAP
jgi:hypothetical protein